MTNAEIFRQAADHMTRHGWTRGSRGWNWEMGGPVCLEGAVLAACKVSSGRVNGWNSHRDGALHPSMEVVAARLGRGIDGPWEWNDQQKTGEPVVTFLEDLAFDEELAEQAKAASLEPAKEPVAV